MLPEVPREPDNSHQLDLALPVAGGHDLYYSRLIIGGCAAKLIQSAWHDVDVKEGS
jgi:hypothetical protein